MHRQIHKVKESIKKTSAVSSALLVVVAFLMAGQFLYTSHCQQRFGSALIAGYEAASSMSVTTTSSNKNGLDGILTGHFDVCIAGAGLSGSVLAERYANVLKKKVLVVEKRDHIGGNCYDYQDVSQKTLVEKWKPASSNIFSSIIRPAKYSLKPM